MKRAAEILRPFNDGPRNSNFHVIHFLSSAGKHFILGTPTLRKFSFSCVDAGQPSISDARFELSFFPLRQHSWLLHVYLLLLPILKYAHETVEKRAQLSACQR